jgi:hypothetical protein
LAGFEQNQLEQSVRCQVPAGSRASPSFVSSHARAAVPFGSRIAFDVGRLH